MKRQKYKFTENFITLFKSLFFRSKPKYLGYTQSEIAEDISTSSIHLGRLKNALKHYSGMQQMFIPRDRKRHYAKIEEAYKKLLNKQLTEHETLLHLQANIVTS